MQICKLFGKSHLPNSTQKTTEHRLCVFTFTHSSTSEIKLNDLSVDLKYIFVVIGHFIKEQEQNFGGQPKIQINTRFPSYL